MYRISEVERAIIERLRRQIPYLRVCTSLARFLVDDMEEAVLNFPAVCVAYQGGEYEHRLNGIQDRRMTFTIFVAARNERGDEASRHGHGEEAGVYGMLDDVRAALTSHSCGLDMDPLLPGIEQAVDGDSRLSVYGITFETRCRFMIP